MLRRELSIAFRARVTWLAAVAAALAVGHGFVLGVELFSGASRSALSNTLMRRELDPLSGIVGPTLGGAQLATAILAPVIAARVLAAEKERNTFGALALAAGSPIRVALVKLVAAALAALLVLVAPLVLVILFGVVGRIDPIEAAIAISGHVLHVLVVSAVSIAAAAWTRTTAQATTAAVLTSFASWVIEAGEGYGALAWLGPVSAVAVSRQLAPFEHGLLRAGALAWFTVALASSFALVAVGASLDLSRRSRLVLGAAIVLLGGAGLEGSTRIARTWDWTELRRASLPPAAVTELRALDVPITIVVWLDREDSRRRQVERDAFAKLILARPDVRFVHPYDTQGGGEGPIRDDAYGTIAIQVGGATRSTRSTSRREIVTLIFDAAGRPLPDWSQESYPGYPVVVEGRRLTLVRAIAYGGVPGGLLVAGVVLARRRRRDPRG